MRLKRIVLLVSTVLVIAVSVVVVATWSFSRYQRAQFEKLSERASALRAGASTSAEVEDLRRLYKSQALLDEWNCEAASCKLRIVVANFMANRGLGARERGLRVNTHFLRSLGIRPAMAIADIYLSNSSVREIEFATTYESTSGDWIWGIWQEMDEFPPALKCESLVLQRHPAYAVRSGRIEPALPTGPFVSGIFQPQASQYERNRLQHIRFDCMTSLFECVKDARLGAGPFMPLVYQDILADKAVQQANPQYSTAVDDCFWGKASAEVKK